MNFTLQRKALLGVAAVGAAVLASSSSAQSLYGIDGPGMLVVEQTGPPAAPCGFPSGPAISGFPTVGGFCPGVPAFPAGVLPGDIAVDKITDTIFVTDGMIIAQYTAGGAFLNSFPSPLPGTTGLGFDSAGGVLWITDGFVAGGMPVPAAPACFGPLPPMPVFPLPVGPGFFVAPVTDIEWDPSTASFFGCDAAGVVGNFLPGGAPGPFGFAALPAAFPVAPFLTGLAVDTSMPGTGTIYITDGAMIGYVVLPAGLAPGPPTFYTPAPFFPSAAGPLSGLAFSSHAIPFGVPSTTGVSLPLAGGMGHSFLGNGAFAATVTGMPGSFASLYFGGGGPLCPPLPILGLLLHLFPVPAPAFLGATPIGPGGVGATPLPIPPTFPVGLGLDFEWVVIEPGGALALSDGLHVTLSLP